MCEIEREEGFESKGLDFIMSRKKKRKKDLLLNVKAHKKVLPPKLSSPYWDNNGFLFFFSFFFWGLDVKVGLRWAHSKWVLGVTFLVP